MAARMAARKRIGDESSKTRALLLDEAERIMFEEGYAAVSTRRVANELGVTGQLVYYYFRDMDELFLSLVQRGSERHMSAVETVLASSDPLHAIWNAYGEPEAARRAFEYMALANHRKNVARVSSDHARQMRRLETAALSRVLSESGVDQKRYPPAGVAMVLAAIARHLGMEKVMGVSEGHKEAKVIVDEFLRFLRGTASTASAKQSASARERSSAASRRRAANR